MPHLIFLEEWGKALIPEKIRPHLHDYLLKAGIVGVNYKFFGALFYACLIIALGLYFYYPYRFFQEQATDLARSIIYLFFGSFAFIAAVLLLLAGLTMLLVYFYLDIRIYNRTKEIERILPEFLQFVAGNLRGGMSFDRALWSAIRPRFGILANEVEIAAKKVMTGEDVDEALKEFTKMYDSPMLRRAFDLIIEGMRSGGKIVYLIDKVIENINETNTLKKEMAASVTSYVIFISFVIMIVAPGLLGLSFQLLTIVSSFTAKLGASAGGAASSMPIKFSSVAIKPEDFVQFSQMCIAVLGGFAAMIISIIKKGDIKSGLKYIPVYIAVGFFTYWLFKLVLSGMFKSLVF